jgi:O-methyltransferase
MITQDGSSDVSSAQLGSTVTSLYLDLLKRTLTNTLFEVEPDADQPDELYFVNEFIDHYIKGNAISMLPLMRFENLQSCIVDVVAKGVRGDLIETGVWRGGATIFMRAVLKAYGVKDRCVWVADSFEGLPEPDAEKYPVEAKAHQGAVMKEAYNHFAASIEDVRRNFQAFGMLDDQVRFLKGWFKDTLPTAPIGAIAIMRLDGDYYESTMDALVNLYDKLSVGGYAIIDDYGEDTWTYCRKAVDDFRRERNIEDPMIRVDSKCYYWQRKR